MQDRNFDDIAEKFSRNIYGTTKGQLRQAILWQDLEPLLAQLGPGPLRVLDAGGGEGQTAIKVAQLGHHVTLCDLSAEMVARARQAAVDKGVIDNMHFVQYCAALGKPGRSGTVSCGAGVGGGAPGGAAYPVVDAASWRRLVVDVLQC